MPQMRRYGTYLHAWTVGFTVVLEFWPLKAIESLMNIHRGGSACAWKSSFYALIIILSLLLLTACIHIPVNPDIKQSSSSLVAQTDVTCLTASTSPLSALPVGDVWSQGLSQEKISVLSWNIYKESRDDWQQDFRQLSEGRDLVLLQEARMNAGLQAELRAPGFRRAMTQATCFTNSYLFHARGIKPVMFNFQHVSVLTSDCN